MTDDVLSQFMFFNTSNVIKWYNNGITSYLSPEKSLFSLKSTFHSSSAHCNFTRLAVYHACRLGTSISCNPSWHWKLWAHLPIGSGSDTNRMSPIIWSLAGHLLSIPIRRLSPFSLYLGSTDWFMSSSMLSQTRCLAKFWKTSGLLNQISLKATKKWRFAIDLVNSQTKSVVPCLLLK